MNKLDVILDIIRPFFCQKKWFEEKTSNKFSFCNNNDPYAEFVVALPNAIDTNTIDTIYVFNGFKFRDELNTLIKTEKTYDKFSDIFTPEEWNNKIKYDIGVKFINENIHIDDSIDIIKLKIFEAINKEASMEEMYLFCLKNEKLNPITVYQNLTQNDKLAS